MHLTCASRRWVRLQILALASVCACSGSTSSAPGDDGASDDDDGGGGGPGSQLGSDPGSVTLRRLNATEYNNTVSDLLGTSLKPADGFTFEDRYGYGFDNNASALDVDDIQLESYTTAAATLAADLLANNTQKAKVFTCDPITGDACVKTILTGFMRRAFRRPVTDEEVARFAALVKVATAEGDSAEAGVGLAIQAVLTSPNFLFRIEFDPEAGSTKPHSVSSHEMASRLSYFLWSTMPDAQLFKAADDDKLKTVDQIKQQTQRMLDDPRSEALIDTFGSLWTPTRVFANHEVDTAIFKNFNDSLREAMLEETRSMLRDLFKGEIGFSEFMNADYTYANDLLAEHYGLPKPGSSSLQKVSIRDTNRGGLLTQGSFLAAPSQPALTSVVKRGRYVFEKLLCGEMSEPPPDVDTTLPVSPGKTVRENFEAHEADPRCAACHKFLDPPGLVLETYDAIGGYRTMDRDLPIDAKVTFETDDGDVTFENALQMGEYISTNAGYGKCITEAVYTFALGRGPAVSDGGGDMDEGVLQTLQKNLKATNWSFVDMVSAVVSSQPFRMRRAFTKGAIQ
jgi:hypothetical protein